MIQKALISAAVLAVLLLALPPPQARACGGFFTDSKSSEVIKLSDVRVMLVHRGGQLEQYVQVGYSGKAANFAWVYPVAGNPQVELVKNDPFTELDEITRPRVTIYTSYGSGSDDGGSLFGCASDGDAALAGNRGQEADPTVKVWQAGQVGSFDYVVITATKVEDMLDWLNSNGFKIPASTQAVLAHYVALKWYFVAMKVSIQSVSADIPSTNVIRLSYLAKEVRYPLRMVSLSPEPTTSFELYLVSTQPDMELTPAGPFAAVEIPTEEVKATSSGTHNYDQVFDGALAKGGPRALVREFSSTNWDSSKVIKGGLPSGAILTRLRTTFTPSVMDQDLVFSLKSHTSLVQAYSLQFDGAQAAAVPPLLVLGAATLFMARSVRRRLRRRG